MLNWISQKIYRSQKSKYFSIYCFNNCDHGLLKFHYNYAAIRMVDNNVKAILTANIWFDAPNYTGEVKAKCIPDDFIICNMDLRAQMTSALRVQMHVLLSQEPGPNVMEKR